MNLIRKTKMLALHVLNRLPVRWRARIKDWRGLNLSPIEQRALLIDVDRWIPKDLPDSSQVLLWRGPFRMSIYNEAIIALSLRLRGISTRFVICDGAMTGCIGRSIEDNKPISEWSERCDYCAKEGARVLEGFGIPYVGMNELVSPERRAGFRRTCNDLPAGDLASYEYYAVPVGQFAKASALRYLRGKALEDYGDVFREYLFSALICAEAARNALNELKPSRLFMQRHIEYVGWAPAYYVLTMAGLPATLWTGSVVPDGGMTLRNAVGTDCTPVYSLSEEAWERRSKQPLTEEQEEALDAMLNSPWLAQQRPIGLACDLGPSGTTPASREMILQELNITDKKPIWCVFTHVTWDAGFNPEVMLFEDVFEWMVDTMGAMLETESATWLLKVHPAETRGTSQGVEEFFKEKFPGVAERIHFIPSNSKITTRELCSVISGGVTMRGTVGVELPARGIPVIVGERSHYAGKGFTYDGFTRERYLELLHEVGEIPLLTEEQRDLARRYAYALYFQRRILLNMAKGRGNNVPLDLKKLDLLFPGNDVVMDMICDRIMNGGEFILDDELAMR